MIVNPLLDEEIIKQRYPEWRKVTTEQSYSSSLVEKIPKEELKEIIKKANLI